MTKNKVMEQINSGNAKEAIRILKEGLEDNALNEELLAELQRAREGLNATGGDREQEGKTAQDLDLIICLYGVTALKSFRTEKEEDDNGPPGDIRFHPDGRVLVVDETRHKVQFFSEQGEFLASFGEKGSGPGEFNYPKKAFCAQDGSILVADAWNHRIQKFDAQGVFLDQFGSYGDEPGQFNEPHGIAIGPNGWIYILDRCNHRVQVFDPEFSLIGSFGRRGTAMECDMAYLFATPQEKFSVPVFEFPTAIESDSRGDLYVADCNNHRVQKVSAFGSAISGWGQRGEGRGEFLYPQAMTVDETGNLFVADMNNGRVKRFTLSGELLYSIKIPGADADPAVAPSALACRGGRLYVGLAFSPRVLVFEYQREAPEGSHRFLNEYASKRTEKNGQGRVVSFAPPGSGSVKAESLEETVSMAEALQEEAECLEKEINKLHEEWVELASSFIPSREKRVASLLRGTGTDMEFDQALYKMERKNIELERGVKLKLVRLKRAHEEAYALSSSLLARSGARDIAALTPLYASWLNRTKGLAALLAGLLSKRAEIFSGTENAFKLFSNGQKEGRGDYHKGFHLLEGMQIPVYVYSTAIEFALSAIKDWVVFLKVNDPAASDWESVFKEVFLGDTAKGLNAILDASGHDHKTRDTIADGIKLLASAFGFAGVSPSCLDKRPLSILREDGLNGIKSSISPLLIPYFMGQAEGGLQVGPLYYEGGGVTEELVDFALKTLSEFRHGCGNVADAIKGFLENQIILIQNIADTEAVLSSGAVTDEKVFLSQTDRKALLSFQERLNVRAMENFFSGLKQDYCVLLPLLLCLKEKGPDTLKELKAELNNSLCVYRNMEEEIGKLLKQKREELMNMGREEPHDIRGASDYETSRERVKSKRLAEGVLWVAELLQKRLADLAELHQCLNRRTPDSEAYKPPARADRRLEPRPDLIMGGFGPLFGRLINPVSLDVDTEERVAVCGLLNHSIRRFTLEGIPVSETGGYGSMPLSFKTPNSITFDARGNAYVLEAATIFCPSNVRVQKISPAGAHLFTINRTGEEGLTKPTDLTLDAQGRVWVSDFVRNKILIFSQEGEFLKAVGEEGDGPGEFRGIWAIEQLDNGDVAVSETGNGRIQILDSEGNHKAFCSTGSQELKAVYRLARGPEGSLFAADFAQHSIYLFDSDYNLSFTFGEFGSGAGKFNGPTGMKAHKGFLFVCDYFNHRVQRFKIYPL